jgi:heat shock protein HtpX
MSKEEVEAVLGHEMAHVANGDMVTLTLIQGVLNTFVIFVSRVIGHLVDRVVLRNERGHGIGFFAATIVSQILLGILASVIVAWFSRRREFRADSGGAQLAGKPSMIAALERLKSGQGEPLPDALKAFGISDRNAFMRLLSTHPPLDVRIAALQQGGGAAA